MARTIAADAHDAGRVSGFRPEPLQPTLMTLVVFRSLGQNHAADAHDAGRVWRFSAKTIAADAHDAGQVPGFHPEPLQTMMASAI